MAAGDVYKITYAGSIHGLERFAHGMHVLDNVGTTDAAILTGADAFLAGFLGAACTSVGSPALMSSAFAPGIVWDTIHVAPLVMATGKQQRPGTSLGIHRVGTGADALTLPFQLSHCVTLLGSTNPGLPRRRNRFYLPPYRQVLSAGGTSKVLTAFMPQLAAAIITARNAMNAATTGLPLCIYSQADGAQVAAVSVHVGDVLDTQRRRRRSLVELRSDAAL